MVTDPVADMMTRIKNAGAVQAPEVSLPYSNHLAAIAEVLKKAGYVSSVSVVGKEDNKKKLVIALDYDGVHGQVQGVRRVSRPSRRVYKKYTEVGRVKGGFGHLFLSTPKGILTNSEAIDAKVGGEALFEIW